MEIAKGLDIGMQLSLRHYPLIFVKSPPSHPSKTNFTIKSLHLKMIEQFYRLQLLSRDPTHVLPSHLT